MTILFVYEGDSICNDIALIYSPTHGLELYTIYNVRNDRSRLYLSNSA